MSDEEEASFPAQLEELDEAECWTLLGTQTVGRIAYSEQAGPVVVPVNYVLHDRAVLFRISPHTLLADRLRGGAASFQVDHIDESTRSGWSVLVRGRAERLDRWQLPEVEGRPTPWPEGSRNFHILLSPATVTGRRLGGT